MRFLQDRPRSLFDQPAGLGSGRGQDGRPAQASGIHIHHQAHILCPGMLVNKSAGPITAVLLRSGK